MLSVSLFFYFSSDKLAKNTLKMCVLFLSSNLLLACLLQSWHKRGVSVYKVFNSNDLTVFSYRFYLYFILDLRRDNNKHNWAYFKL